MERTPSPRMVRDERNDSWEVWYRNLAGHTVSPVTIYALGCSPPWLVSSLSHASLQIPPGGSSLRPEGNQGHNFASDLPLYPLVKNLHVGIEERDMYSLGFEERKSILGKFFCRAENRSCWNNIIRKIPCAWKKKSLLESKVNFFLMANFKPT